MKRFTINHFLAFLLLINIIAAPDAWAKPIDTAIQGTKQSGGNKSNKIWIGTSIGDSISNRASYHPVNIDYNLTKAPLWSAGATFAVGNIMHTSTNGLYYASAITTGVTGSTEPTHVTGAAVDGGVTWTYYPAFIARDATSFQRWAELYGNGNIRFDQNIGWKAPEFSTIKCYVQNGGTGYVAPTISFTPPGTTANLVTANGVITDVVITNSGRNATGALSTTINDVSGTGAAVTCAFNNSGYYTTSGTTSAHHLKMVGDVCASSADFVTVMSGTNDITLNIVSYATLPTEVAKTTANLRSMYESIKACGKEVIAITIPARTAQNAGYQLAGRNQINRFIRAFARKEVWANPNQINITIADPNPWTIDNSTVGDPQSGFNIADGLHPATRMAQVTGYFVEKSAEVFAGPALQNYQREDGYGNGYNLTYNPYGNMYEGLIWSASTTYNNVGDFVSNDTNKVYRLSGTVPCTTAASGGPTGTGAGITDGTCTWNYVRAGGLSVLGAGTAGTNTAAGGIVFTGTPPSGTVLARQVGSAAGTVVQTVENPRSDGRAGQRHVLTFSLGSGTATEQWRILLGNPSTTVAGIAASDFENKFYVLEVELEISNYANMYPPYISLFGQSAIFTVYDGWGANSGAVGFGSGYELLPTTHELAWPAGKKMVLKTTPIQIPNGTTSLNSALYLNWNASGAADTATGTIKINSIILKPVQL